MLPTLMKNSLGDNGTLKHNEIEQKEEGPQTKGPHNALEILFVRCINVTDDVDDDDTVFNGTGRILALSGVGDEYRFRASQSLMWVSE